jgi:hypothetical protein
MDLIYDTCEKEGKPIVMHVGREPKSGEYAWDMELKWVKQSELSFNQLEWVMHKSTELFSNIQESV